MAKEAAGDDFSASAWGTHSTNNCAIDDIPYSPILMIIPTSLIKVLPNQLNRRLRSIGVILRHIQIINKQSTFLPKTRTVVAFSSLNKFIVNDSLGLKRSGLC